jgi:RNA ligase (TIGR02306 family)
MSSLIVEVCKIDQVEKHHNADRLSIATVKGWNCIVGLDQYKAGDLVVYIPPDSIIPDELVEKYNLEYLRNGNRVRTTRLRGYISQGLILPLPEGKFKEGDDVAKTLGITKWEPPAPSYQQGHKNTSNRNPNPFFDKYVDMENIKNYPNVFSENDKVVITEKLHGTSWRAGIHPRLEKGFWNKVKSVVLKLIGKYDTHEFVYGSRNVQLSYTGHKGWYGEDIYGQIAKKYNMKDIIPKDYAVYGEVVGEGIQDLTYGRKELELFVYDVKYKGRYLPYDEFKQFCDERGLQTVPVLYIGDWSTELLSKFTDGKSIMCPTQIREGCVVKDFNENNHSRVGRKILKSISPDYLMRKDATEFH